MNLRDLKLRARALFSPNRVEHDLNEELQFHIERETHKLMDQGLSPEDARFKAQAKFGSTTVAADECRDERGTAFIDNTVSDFFYALRSFRRAPLAALTIVGTVSLGLGVVAVLFSILNIFMFRVDTAPDITEMYEVNRPSQSSELPDFTRPQFEALRRDTTVFTDAYATMIEVDLRVDGRVSNVSLVTGNFFSVVRMNPVMGRALTPADDERGGSPVVVLSDLGWERRFNRDPNVLGRTVLVSGAPYDVIGVMPAGFRGLQVSAPDMWAPLSRVGDFQPDSRGFEDKVGIDIVGRLRPGMTMENARAQLTAWNSNLGTATVERGDMNVELLPRQGTVPQPMEILMVFTPLFIVFGLILMIGCANVANLLLARGVARQKEIGIRLSLGASRRRIVRQLLTESVLLALMAAVGGYVISRLALEGTVAYMMRTMPMDLGDVNLGVPAADWRVALFLVVTAIAATAFFALIPALQATRVEPVRTMRGELVKDAKPGRARNVLIGLQVFASALLLITAAIFLRSSSASAQFDPGLRTADTMLIEINEPKRAAMLQSLASEPIITMHAAMRPPLLSMPLKAFADTGSGSKTPASYKFVSEPYFDVLGIPILRGRGFSPAERNDTSVAIVTDTLARTLWPNGSGVGETFVLEADPSPKSGNALLQVNPDAGGNEPIAAPRTVTVIGVAREVPGFRLTDVRDASVFLPTSMESARTTVVARVQGDPTIARDRLLERFTKIDPNMGQIITLRTVARLELFFLEIAFSVSMILGGLALLLTVSGLFSVLSYLVEQRTKEIGVRMALGASTQKVTQLMLAQTTRPVLIGLLAGAGLAASLATLVLSSEFGALISTIVHVTDPVAYAGSLLVIIVACMFAAWIPARSAAKVDPMKTLRQE
jgi:predicted permease